MSNPLRILLLEDDPGDVEILQWQLKKSQLSFSLHVADSRKNFIAGLNDHRPHVILSDHSLPSFNSLEALRIVREKVLDIPFILVTGSISEEFAVQCMREGADDYILKSSLTRLPSAIENSLSRRETRREKKLIESLHAKLQDAYSEIEQRNNDIRDSISYARRIQDAMLPPKATLDGYVDEAFIIYRPKDVISGDFYWFAETGNVLVVAAADCTGHGVPGALVSMIGTNLLNDIVSIRKITQPDEILGELNSGIRKLLRQDVEGAGSQDGMDITLCSIDKRTQTLRFAGANNHLFYFRGKKLELYKGDRKSVGGFQAGPDKPYTCHEMRYDPGDTFFMFSDGYADQFGGRDDKRMKTRNLIKLLESTLALGLPAQEQLLHEWYDQWKGGSRQTDDVLLIGIRL